MDSCFCLILCEYELFNVLTGAKTQTLSSNPSAAFHCQASWMNVSVSLLLQQVDKLTVVKIILK